MKQITKYALAALLAGSAAVASTAPAEARVGFSIGFAGPGYSAQFYDGGRDYYGYNYWRPCSFYFRYELPAPSRCYRDYYGYYGPSVYLSNGFVFRDRGHFGQWRNRDDFRHWRGHNWNVSHDRGNNWRGHDNGGDPQGHGDNWRGHDNGGNPQGGDNGGRSHDHRDPMSQR